MPKERHSVLHRLDALLRPLWMQLAPRERLASLLAAIVVVLALLWGLAILPAVTTLRLAPTQHQQLDVQLETMRRMAATARQLRQQAQDQRLSTEMARRALQQATADTLGITAQLLVQESQATVTLRGAAPDALARWLEQVRLNARVVPVQADLQQTTDPAGWSGQLVLSGAGLEAGH